MLGDILIIKEIHKEAARAIKKRIIADLEKKREIKDWQQNIEIENEMILQVGKRKFIKIINNL